MVNYSGIFWLLFIIFQALGSFIFVLAVFIKKVKHGWLYLLLAILVTVSGLYIHHRIAHLPFEHFNKEVCEAHPEVKNVKFHLAYQGQQCQITVDVADHTDAETIERLFIDLMKRINEEPVSGYIKHSANSDWLIIMIDFRGGDHQHFTSKQYRRSDWFTKENQQVQTWENDGTPKVYHFADYVTSQTDLPNTPFQYPFQLDGCRYSLPVKADFFVKNGWTFGEEGSLKSGEDGTVSLKKNNREITLTIQNPNNQKSEYSSCEVNGISITKTDPGNPFDFSIFNGIKVGMPQDQLERKIQNLYYYTFSPQEGDTDYHILDDLYFEEGYGYLIHTHGGLISSIELHYLADGVDREKRTTEVTDHWRNDPVKHVEPDTVLPIDFNCIYEADINQDGKNDTIDFKLLNDHDGTQTLLSVVNGTVNLLRRDTSVRDAYLIPRSNGTCAVLFDLEEIDDYNPCCIYQLLDTRCEKTGELKGNVVPGTFTKDTLTLESFLYVIGAGWSSMTDYTITNYFTLARASDSRLTDTVKRHGIKVKKELDVTLYDSAGNSFASKLEPGDTVLLTETDFVTVLRFTTEDGRSGSIEISPGKEQNCCFLYYEGVLLTDYFDENTLIFAG